MIIYILLTTFLIKQLYRFYYPVEHEMLVNLFEKKISELKTRLEPTLMTISYNTIYYYSVSQIYCNKIIKYTTPYINLVWKSIIHVLAKNNIITDKIQLPVKFVSVYKNGKEIQNFIHCEENYGILKNTIDNDFPLVILSDKENETNCVNKIQLKQYGVYVDYTYSKLKFISMDLTYNNITYPIVLKNDIYNHYIVDNILNKEFFKYYLTNILNVKLENDSNFDYNLSLIDNDVNMHVLNSNEYLVIKEENYEIHCVKENEVTTEETVTQEISDENYDASSDKSDDYVKLESSN